MQAIAAQQAMTQEVESFEEEKRGLLVSLEEARKRVACVTAERDRHAAEQVRRLF